MRPYSALLCCLLAAGCMVPPPPTAALVAGGDTGIAGAGFATAIVIEASGEMEGYDAQYAWIRANRPDWAVIRHERISRAGRTYEVMTIRKGGVTRYVCFDISKFAGRL